MLVFALFPHNSEWFFPVVSKMFKTETIIFVKNRILWQKLHILPKA